MMSNVNRNLRDRNDKDNYATYSFISSWDKNYKSWKLSKNINKILIKYEDLENDIENTFLKIIKFFIDFMIFRAPKPSQLLENQ